MTTQGFSTTGTSRVVSYFSFFWERNNWYHIYHNKKEILFYLIFLIFEVDMTEIQKSDKKTYPAQNYIWDRLVSFRKDSRLITSNSNTTLQHPNARFTPLKWSWFILFQIIENQKSCSLNTFYLSIK